MPTFGGSAPLDGDCSSVTMKPPAGAGRFTSSVNVVLPLAGIVAVPGLKVRTGGKHAATLGFNAKFLVFDIHCNRGPRRTATLNVRVASVQDVVFAVKTPTRPPEASSRAPPESPPHTADRALAL